MTVGLRIRNPDGHILALLSSVKTYAYAGAPTLISSGSVSYAYSSSLGVYYGTVTPYVYRVDTGDATKRPLIAIIPKSDRIIEIDSIVLYSGTTWEIRVYSVVWGPHENIQTVTVVAPEIYVFTQYTNADAITGPGMVMRNAGQITFSTARVPAWVRVITDFPSAIESTTSGSFYLSGQSYTIPSLTKPMLLIGFTNASALATKQSSGEDVFLMGYGWRVSGTTLSRIKYIRSWEQRTFDAGDEIIIKAARMRPMILEGALY